MLLAPEIEVGLSASPRANLEVEIIAAFFGCIHNTLRSYLAN